MKAFLYALVITFCAMCAPHAAAQQLHESLEMLPAGQVLVVLDDRKIYYRPRNERNAIYTIRIAVGRPGMDQDIIGQWEVTKVQEWPTWTPPAEMIARKPELARWAHGMPGGEDNPLGARAIYLGTSLYRIHGTNEPESIGSAVSSGCIRVHNDLVAWLAARVHVGDTVVVLQALEDYLDEIPAGGTVVAHHEDEADPEPYEGFEEDPDEEDEEEVTSLY